MGDPFKVFVVDDDAIVLDIMRTILEPDCAVETFDSVEACQPRLNALRPDMFLLDVSLPGMDGFTFCRLIKDDAALSRVPVTFVSSHDTIEERLLGYNAGGEDFIVKPFEPEEVLKKIMVAQQITLNQQALQEQAEMSENLVSMAMASMGEADLVLQFMSKLIGWKNEQEVADGLLELLRCYQLDGVVQTRIAQRSLTLSAAGTNLPLEASVMNHVQTMDRVFEFHNRSVHNFDHVTLMISNMPVEDNPGFCARLRDNLSVAVQGADSRLCAIENEEINRRNQAGILEAMESVRELIGSSRQTHLRNMAASSDLLLELEQNMAKSFVHMGLSGEQERCQENLVSDFSKRLLALLDRGEESHRALLNLSERLGQLR